MSEPAQDRHLLRLHYRTAVRHSDLIEVGEIVNSSGYFSQEEVETAVELVEEALLDGQFSCYSFVFAEDAGLTLAYSCYGQIPLTHSSYDMYWIAVRNEYRGKGIGKAILEVTEAEILNAGGTQIYVDTSGRAQYASTRAFYESKGYQAEAVLCGFYAPGDDKIIYRKDLTRRGTER